MYWPVIVLDMALLWLCRYLWRREKGINPEFKIRYSIADLLVLTMGVGVTYAMFTPRLQSSLPHKQDDTLALLLILVPHQIAMCFAFRLESIWPGISKAPPLHSALFVVVGLIAGVFIAPLITGTMVFLVFVVLCLLPVILPFVIITEVMYALGRKSVKAEQKTADGLKAVESRHALPKTPHDGDVSEKE